jgi:GNAT superfamily N-acetyltransferase
MLYHSLKNKFQGAKVYHRQFGFGKTLLKAAKVIIFIIYKQNVMLVLLEKDLNQKIQFSLNYKLEVQRIEEKHREVLQEFIKKHSDEEDIAPVDKINDYFANNYEGFIGLIQGEVIGYFWWVNNKIVQKNHPDLTVFNIRLKNDAVYGFDFVIIRQYRGSGNATEFLYKVHSALIQLGYNRIFGVVLPDNIPAAWLYKLFGFKDVKKIISRRFFYFILFINNLIFLKTRKQCFYYPFGYRALYPFKNVMFLNK